MTRPFDIQGHRGARALFPENTLAGFQAAYALGVTTFELDVGLTADGLPPDSWAMMQSQMVEPDGAATATEAGAGTGAVVGTGAGCTVVCTATGCTVVVVVGATVVVVTACRSSPTINMLRCSVGLGVGALVVIGGRAGATPLL